MIKLNLTPIAFSVFGMLVFGSAHAENPKTATLPTFHFDVATTDFVRSYTIDANGTSISAKEYSADGVTDITIEVRESSVTTTRKNAISEVRTFVDLKAAATYASENPARAQEDLRLFESFQRQLDPTVTLTNIGAQVKGACTGALSLLSSATQTMNSACAGQGPGQPQTTACANATSRYNGALATAIRICGQQEN